MIVRVKVEERLPAPARTTLNLVQSALAVQRKVAERLIHDGAVRCEGRMITKPHERFNVGQILEVERSSNTKQPASLRKPAKKKWQLEVLHEDADIVVVNKPAEILTVPTAKRESHTLFGLLQKHCGCELKCVQRLDLGVSGVVAFAKNAESGTVLQECFAAHIPVRRYLALVQGNLKPPQDTIRSYLTTDRKLKRHSNKDKRGELAITHYSLQERWNRNGNEISLIELSLETGRRNQIRVHMADRHCPIIGDTRYRRYEAAHEHWPYNRIALHAAELSLPHPRSGEPLNFETPWPIEFREFRRAIFGS